MCHTVTPYCRIFMCTFKLRDKDRNLVKDRFKHFNAELEDMVASHQRYSVPDSGLRDEMRQKVKEMIQPHYSGSFSH